ncbi:DUF420 domain-containing protein [Metabacillus sp. KIGAM252]|uniref:DUF420 domain-containing protein n=1 Tax=Metabacillus flavus TaxID=2823519 RepID=A0ABS5LDZ6_9BACI|nr:DUF420 domain-containing protein [Metabacillus flavus]MBS2968841.1 DUF420 domain-containing protein [Metabacillus flavus]
MYLPLLPTISTAFIVISAVFVAIGWYLIAKRRVEAHRKAMTWAGVFALVFFIVYVSRTVFDGNTAFGGPPGVKVFYLAFLIFHIFLAASGGVFGIVSIWSGYRQKIIRHRRLGPITSIIWFSTAVTGVTVYMLLYIIYGGGETVPVIKAITGF